MKQYLVLILLIITSFANLEGTINTDAQLLPEATIHIQGNVDLLETAQEQGWSGTGTVEDPISISGLSIDNIERTYLLITDTTLNLIIEYSTFTMASDIEELGRIDFAFIFGNTSNIVLRNVDIINFPNGISIKGPTLMFMDWILLVEKIMI